MAQVGFIPQKIALTYEEQLKLLQSRGLNINNFEEALNILSRVNYYKLSGYSLHLREDNIFHENVSFETIYETYIFDKRLSSILIDLIESVEVTFKTQVAYHIAHTMSPTGYLNSANFYNHSFHEEFVEQYNKEKDRRLKHHVKFVEQNVQKYGELPIWIAIEILSLGSISKLYSNMMPIAQNAISKNAFGIKSYYLRTWMEGITNVRNRCAHHSRHYNRSIPKSVPLFKKDKQSGINPSSLFAIFIILKTLILNTNQWNRIIIELEVLFLEFSTSIDISKIGFPNDWKCKLQK